MAPRQKRQPQRAEPLAQRGPQRLARFGLQPQPVRLLIRRRPLLESQPRLLEFQLPRRQALTQQLALTLARPLEPRLPVPQQLEPPPLEPQQLEPGLAAQRQASEWSEEVEWVPVVSRKPRQQPFAALASVPVARLWPPEPVQPELVWPELAAYHQPASCSKAVYDSKAVGDRRY